MNNENITNIIEDNNNTECITSLGKLIIAFNYLETQIWAYCNAYINTFENAYEENVVEGLLFSQYLKILEDNFKISYPVNEENPDNKNIIDKFNELKEKAVLINEGRNMHIHSFYFLHDNHVYQKWEKRGEILYWGVLKNENFIKLINDILDLSSKFTEFEKYILKNN